MQANRDVLLVVLLILALLVSANADAREKVPTGVIAASIDDRVVLFDVVSGRHSTIESGPVSWLFPAPGGVLFAPDLVHRKTNVINLRRGRMEEVIDGVTMPHFGEFRDRYFVIGEQVLLVSYPERALIAKVDVKIEDPWQVIVPKDGRTLLVLARRFDGEGGARLAAIDMVHRKQLYDTGLPGDMIDMEFLPDLAVVAMAERDEGWVRFVSPSTLRLVGSHAVAGLPVGVESVREGRYLAVAVARGEAASAPALRFLKIKRKAESIEVKKDLPLELPKDPVAMVASPDGLWLGVMLDDGSILIVDAKEREVVSTLVGEGLPRDLVWCDPLGEGPLIEAWSDRDEEELELEPGTWTPKGDPGGFE